MTSIWAIDMSNQRWILLDGFIRVDVFKNSIKSNAKSNKKEHEIDTLLKRGPRVILVWYSKNEHFYITKWSYHYLSWKSLYLIDFFVSIAFKSSLCKFNVYFNASYSNPILNTWINLLNWKIKELVHENTLLLKNTFTG